MPKLSVWRSEFLFKTMKEALPVDIALTLSYQPIHRLSILANVGGNFMLPKNGTTADYNSSTNIGGGIGYVILPDKDGGLGNFELRGLVASSVSGKQCKHTSYTLGLYWYSHCTRRSLRPVIGLGYNAKDFRDDALPTYHGAFVSFGVRF